MTESHGTIRRLSAGVMGLAGFIVALLAGLQAGNETGRVIVTALGAMLVCHVAGMVLGLVIERVVEEHKRAISAPKQDEIEGVQAGASAGSDRSSRLAA